MRMRTAGIGCSSCSAADAKWTEALGQNTNTQAAFTALHAFVNLRLSQRPFWAYRCMIKIIVKQNLLLVTNFWGYMYLASLLVPM